MEFTLLIVIIVLALIFDYINGFHVMPMLLLPLLRQSFVSFQAVLWAAFFNFSLLVLDLGGTVAKTSALMEINLVILAGVIAAICWNLLTWWLGIPSSSSHTLIGGFMGAAVAHAIAVHMVFRLFTGGWDYCLLVRHR
jgi:PiT family inorganic phosphate transporter